MSAFVSSLAFNRVVFGTGTLQSLPDELSRLGVKAAVILCTPQQVALSERIAALIGSSAVGVFTEAAMHTPTSITEKAIAYVQAQKADCVVSAGGGSTTGLGKAISIRTGFPHVSIPTTYAGSEMTPILGETKDGLKTTRSDPAILPTTVIYDVSLTKTLPAAMSATSGINAMAHSIEALYATNTTPIVSLLALESIKALAVALPTLITSPQDDAAREQALYGAWLAGVCLGNTTMALHHKLCHTLGGSFNLPHAETHTIVLPHALAYNAPKVPEVMKKLAEVIPDSNGDAIQGLNALLRKLQVKTALKDFGMKEADVDKAVEIAMANPYKNPRALEQQALRDCIYRAWNGDEAKTS